MQVVQYGPPHRVIDLLVQRLARAEPADLRYVGVHHPHRHRAGYGLLGESFELDVTEALVREARLPLLDTIARGNVFVALEAILVDVLVLRENRAIGK